MEQTVLVVQTGIVEVYLIGFNCLRNAASSLSRYWLLLDWGMLNFNFRLIHNLIWVLACETSMSFCLSFSSISHIRWLGLESVTLDTLNLIWILFWRQSCILVSLLNWAGVGRGALIGFTVE